MQTEIILVRHGETEANNHGVLHGRTDLPLTERGRLQAALVAERLASVPGVSALLTSPLQRALATAETIGRRLGLRPTVDHELRELDFGDFEGWTFQDIRERHPELFARLVDVHDLDAGFPNGETRRQFHSRVRRAFETLRQRYAASRVIVVAHNGVIASGLAQLLSGDPNKWDQFMVANCSITHLVFDDSGAVTLRCWNDVAHLGQVGEATRWKSSS
ncbi:MAG: histidine phosphatase family protein [Sphaerobacter sp.]|nr:histidine phosphatase family protein [Sphaerobacter sp.]